MRDTVRSRGTIVAVALVVMVAALATATGPAGAASKVTAAGNVHCTGTGRVSIAPKLTAALNPKTKLTVTANVTCTTGTTGTSGLTVVSGHITAKIGPVNASCTTTSFGGGTALASWKTNGTTLAQSKLTFATTTATDGTNVVLDLVGPGGPGSGSFHDEDVKLHVVGDATTGGLCGKASRGFPFRGAGGTSTLDITTPNPHNLPVNHVVVLMQENRSADTYLGPLSTQGQPAYEPEPTTGNPDPTNPLNPPIVPFHKTSLCEVADLDHSWTGTHNEFDGGAMDGFTAQNAIPADPTGSRAMGHYDQTDLPYYYALHSTFSTADRYFASILTQTFPNRMYLLAGTSFGHIANDIAGLPGRSVFNLLDEHSISWKIYSTQYPLSYGTLFFAYATQHRAGHLFPMSQYYADAASGNLPDVAYVDPAITEGATGNDEHPPADVQDGQKFVHDVFGALMAGPNWSTSAAFFAYDEHGGFYDHVAPPAAVAPDAIPPMLKPGDTVAGFDHYGIRVPAAVVSPYSKPAHVSHDVYDHTSILKFIEYRYGLPSLTNRDAAASPMLDMFDFSTPAFATPPILPNPPDNPC